MTKLTIGRMEVFDTMDGSAEATLTLDGRNVGSITKDVSDHGGTTREYRTDGYTVDMIGQNEPKFFDAACYDTGARGALAAAKAWAKGQAAALDLDEVDAFLGLPATPPAAPAAPAADDAEACIDCESTVIVEGTCAYCYARDNGAGDALDHLIDDTMVGADSWNAIVRDFGEDAAQTLVDAGAVRRVDVDSCGGFVVLVDDLDLSMTAQGATKTQADRDRARKTAGALAPAYQAGALSTRIVEVSGNDTTTDVEVESTRHGKTRLRFWVRRNGQHGSKGRVSVWGWPDRIGGAPSGDYHKNGSKSYSVTLEWAPFLTGDDGRNVWITAQGIGRTRGIAAAGALTDALVQFFAILDGIDWAARATEETAGAALVADLWDVWGSEDVRITVAGRHYAGRIIETTKDDQALVVRNGATTWNLDADALFDATIAPVRLADLVDAIQATRFGMLERGRAASRFGSAFVSEAAEAGDVDVLTDEAAGLNVVLVGGARIVGATIQTAPESRRRDPAPAPSIDAPVPAAVVRAIRQSGIGAELGVERRRPARIVQTDEVGTAVRVDAEKWSGAILVGIDPNQNWPILVDIGDPAGTLYPLEGERVDALWKAIRDAVAQATRPGVIYSATDALAPNGAKA